MNKLLWLGLCAWLGLTLCPGRAAVWYVATNGSDAASGTNWAEAYATIGNALASNAIVAGENHEIWVSNGTYSLDEQLYLDKGVRLVGAGGAGQTILDGGRNDRCVFINAGVLDGFTVTNGLAPDYGGGIYIMTGQVVNCTVTGNEAPNAGGGIFGRAAGNGIISNCVIAGNSATNAVASYYGGGGVHVGGSRWQVLDCPSIRDNKAIYVGGGLYMYGTGTIHHCGISNNEVGWYSGGGNGGGMYVTQTTKVSRCSISDNKTTSTNGQSRSGGGIYAAYGVLVTECTVVSNEAFNGAGIYLLGSTGLHCLVRQNLANGTGTIRAGGVYLHYNASAGPSLLSNCTISENSSLSRAGGLFAYGVQTVQQCEVVDNYANLYGGVEANSAALVMRNCLVARNVTDQNGGGICLWPGGGFVSTLDHCTIVSNRATGTFGGGLFTRDTNAMVNCIIYSNRAGSVHDVYLDRTGSTFTNCCTPTAASLPGANNIPDYPVFADPSNNDWRLTADSPCVNAGTNEPWIESAVDLDGRARADRFSRQVDIGAYEYIPAGSMIELR